MAKSKGKSVDKSPYPETKKTLLKHRAGKPPNKGGKFPPGTKLLPDR